MGIDCNSCRRFREDPGSNDKEEILEIIYSIHKGCEIEVFELLDEESKASLKETLEPPLPETINFNIQCISCETKYAVKIDWLNGSIIKKAIE